MKVFILKIEANPIRVESHPAYRLLRICEINRQAKIVVPNKDRFPVKYRHPPLWGPCPLFLPQIIIPLVRFFRERAMQAALFASHASRQLPIPIHPQSPVNRNGHSKPNRQDGHRKLPIPAFLSGSGNATKQRRDRQPTDEIRL